MKQEEVTGTKWLRMLPMALGAFGATLDNNIINTCLPAIVRDLDCGVSMGQFIASAYTFTICSLILFFAYVSLYIGRRRMFSQGLMLFSVSSFAAAMSGSIRAILLARVLQGVGAAMFMSNGMALINSSFDNEHKGRAFGIQATAIAVASMSGPALGAMIASRLGWQTNFIVLSLVVLPAVALARTLLDEERYESNTSFTENFDLTGTIYSILAVLLLVAGFTFLKNRQLILFLLLLAVDTLIWAVFFRREKSIEKPVINIAALNDPVFIKNNILAFIVYSVMMGASVITPIYLFDRMKLELDITGMIMSLTAIATFAVTFFSGAMADKKSPDRIILLGKIMITAALVILLLGFRFGSMAVISVANVFLGLGIGLFNPPNNKEIMLSVDKKYSAAAASINVLVRNIGISVGIAMAGILYDLAGGIKLAEVDIAAELTIMFFLSLSVVGILLCIIYSGLIKAKSKKSIRN